MKKKLFAGIILFPWSVFILPALPYLDKLSHSFGLCLGF